MLALLPALAVSIAGLLLNHFSLVDDSVIVLITTRNPLHSLWTLSNGSRWFPLYWFCYGLLFRIFPASAWPMALLNGACLIASSALLYRLGSRMGGRWAGVLAAWLAISNVAAAECFFTLAKPEPKQLVFWLIAASALLRLLELPGAGAGAALVLTAGVVAGSLLKETGVVLALPLLAWLLLTLRDRAALPRERFRMHAAAALSALLGAGLCLIPLWLWSIRPGSYARDVVFRPISREAGFAHDYLLLPNAQLVLLLLAGLVSGLYLVRFDRDPLRRRFAGFCLLLLAAFCGLFLCTRLNCPYYFYPGAAIAALLIATGLPRWRETFIGRFLGPLFAGFLLLWGAQNLLTGASTLAGWSWLHDRLTAEVVKAAPPRILLVEVDSVTRANMVLNWGALHGLNSELVEYTPGMALRPGDWLIEPLGSPECARITFRSAAYYRSPATTAIVTPPGMALDEKRLLTARFPAFSPWPFRGFTRRSFLAWRIQEARPASGESAPGPGPARLEP